jgi:O-antigen chain-terminating methyltransferase
MSANSPSTNADVTQLVQKIREQIRQRSEQSNNQGAQVGTGTSTASFPAQLRASLRSINEEINALSLQAEKGEPEPQAVTLRGRFGFLIKRQLYRLLWWHSYQLKTLVALITRHNHEELKIIETLSLPSEQIHQIKRQVQETENRLRQLESAQLKLQAAEVERNVRTTAAQAEQASLHQELREVKNAINEVQARLPEKFSDYARVTQRIDELAQRLEAEAAQRDQMAIRLSELGLSTQATRATLSIQDRRLALFIQEARKRLPQPFTDDQLQKIVTQHNSNRYDSLYAAFEDVFRGSRDEIKAKQSVYLPLLREHEIGSPKMPILDLGCGRGEWLELLKEGGLQASGIDCNETAIQYCKSAGLDVIYGDALSSLGTLRDTSIGAVTSFHMIEHLPFEVTLALIDEALRVLKTGGILILETPNPQNMLVGAHTFYLDPTHLRPLPSAMLRFFVEARGFCNVQVRELNPYPASMRLADDGKGLASRLNDYLYGPQDYSVIGQKP